MSHTSGKPPLKAFISYKWEDDAHNNWVKRLATDLRKAGIEAILDRWEVRLGDSFTDYMTSRINAADVVLFVITTASVASVESPKGKGGAVKFEMQMATARRTAGERVRLIGIYREGDKTPLYLRDHRYADFRDDSRYEQSLRELVADLLDEVQIPPVGEPSFADEQAGIELHETKMATDGVEMRLIPAGEFQMGSDEYDGEKPVHPVYLGSFYMDAYEVTNECYARFLNEYGRTTDEEGHELLSVDSKYCLIEKTGNAYRPKTGYEDHPVVMVSWYGAATYAQFYGKRLPTEAEWEKAARGGLVGKKYPWGDEITQENANYDTGGTTPVGNYPPNDYGLYDMAGNVWEWCADWYSKDYYSASPERNPTGPDSGNSRVLRGDGWCYGPGLLRVACRLGDSPTFTSGGVGFRCVSQD